MRFLRMGTNNAPRPFGQGYAGRPVRPMGPGVASSPYVTHRYFDATGTQVWRADHGSAVFAIAVDASGNVYTAGGSLVPSSFNRLSKWNSSGVRQWSILSDGKVGSGVACDSNGDIWLAIGEALEKYSTSGVLLASYNSIGEPFSTMSGGSHISYCPDISRVAVSPNDKVVFGTSGFSTTTPATIFNDNYELPGNTMNIDGTGQAVFRGNGPQPPSYSNSSHNVAIVFNGYDFDSDSNFYTSNWFASTPMEAIEFFVSSARVFTELTYLDPYSGVQTNFVSGNGYTNYFNSDYPNYKSAGQIAVHRPSGKIMMAFGAVGAGRILDITTLIPGVPGGGGLEAQTDLVAEAGAGQRSVLRVNDNHRYIYGYGSTGFQWKVRDYPSTFVWEGDHKAALRDAIIKSDDTVLVAGDRVLDA